MPRFKFASRTNYALEQGGVHQPLHSLAYAKLCVEAISGLAFERLSSDVPVHPVTLDIARLAGRIEGQQEAIGVQFAFEDLLIGATALHLGYEVATLNLRDFQRIPGLSVIQL